MGNEILPAAALLVRMTRTGKDEGTGDQLFVDALSRLVGVLADDGKEIVQEPPVGL